MANNWLNGLNSQHRVLIKCSLRPRLGTRFQSTGFQGLGPARYQLHDGTEMLLVESAQSVANRLEAACWDDATGDLIEQLKGLPYVKIDLGDYGTTSTWEEFHRLNSPYIWTGKTNPAGEAFRNDFKSALGVAKESKGKSKDQSEAGDGDGEKDVPGVLDMRKLAQAVFRYDPNSIIHGIFLTKVAGRLRLSRALSGFIEARNVREVESGGVKFDRVLPGGLKLSDAVLDAKEGFGNVPFHRVEFTAEEISAYFNLDLALLRGYGLPKEAEDLLVSLSMLKVRRFLEYGLRLRTACDLEVDGDTGAIRPTGFALPSEEDLLGTVQASIKACTAKGLFTQPPVIEMTWEPEKKKAGKSGRSKPDQKGSDEDSAQSPEDNEGGL